MSAVRRPAVLLTVALAALLATLAGALGLTTTRSTASSVEAADDIPLTFDWPLDCDIVVEQRYERGGVLHLAAEFVVELSEGGSPGNLLLRSGPALVTAVADQLSIDLDEPTPSHYWTNPTIEIDRAGNLLTIAMEEWEESGPSETEPDDVFGTATMMPTDFRVMTATWPTWVGVWAQLETIDGFAETAIVGGSELTPRTWPLTAIAEPRTDGLLELYGSAPLGDGDTRFDLTAVVDPLTLQPHTARFDYFPRPSNTWSEAFDWTFDWSACDDATTVSELAPLLTAPTTTSTTVPAITAVTVPGFRTIHVDDLPPEAHDTLALIADGGPFPYRQDDSVFGNREGLLPRRPNGYYREFTVETPGLSHRGARRIITGDGGELFYTDDHYDSFRVIVF